MRTPERLKEIFIIEANYMIDHYFKKADKIATGIIEHKDVSDQYNEYKELSKMQMDKYNLTEEEQEYIKSHAQEWQVELLPTIAKKIYPDFNV